MTYKFNRKTYLTAEDLIPAFVEDIDSLEMAKLHLKNQFIELWLKDIRDFDTLIFLKKLKEDLNGDFELIILELLFYLNPDRAFGFLGYPNLEISGLERITRELTQLNIKSQEASYLLNNLYSGRLSAFYRIYNKHSKRKDFPTERLLVYLSGKTLFNTINPENIFSETILRAVLKTIDVHLNPTIYCIHKSYFIDSLPYIPTIDEINILNKYFPEGLRNTLDILEQYNSKSDTANCSSEEVLAEFSLICGTHAIFIQHFLIDFISKKIPGFTAENWVIKINNFLNENSFSLGEVFFKKKYLKFNLSGKWGVISTQDYKKIINNNYSDIKAFEIPQQNDFFLGKASEEEWAVLDHEGSLLSYSQSDEFTFSEEFTFQNCIIRPFDSVGRRITGIFNKNNERLYPFDEVYEFKEGFAITKSDGKYNFLSLEGKILLNHPIEEATDFHNNFACIKVNKKWGIINKSGEELSIVKFWNDCGKLPDKIDGILYDRNIGSLPTSKGGIPIIGSSTSAIFDDISATPQVEKKNPSFSEKIITTVKVNDYLLFAELKPYLKTCNKPACVINHDRHNRPSQLINNAEYFKLNILKKSKVEINDFSIERDSNFYFLKRDNKIFLPKFS